MAKVSLVLHFLAVWTLAFSVSSAFSYLWSLVTNGAGIVDWERSSRLAVTLGIVLTWVHARTGGTSSH